MSRSLPPGPPGPPRHTHDDGTVCLFDVTSGGWRWISDTLTAQLRPCPDAIRAAQAATQETPRTTTEENA